MSVEMTAPTELKEIVINGTDHFIEQDTKRNMIYMLETKRHSLQASSRCHDFLSHRFRFWNRVATAMTIAAGLMSFALSATQGKSENQVNVPIIITSGIALAVKGFHEYGALGEKAKAHQQSGTAALDIADDLEYIILKRNHTRESLQQAIDIFGERIKSFRKNEAPIPLDIKQRLLQRFGGKT
jgi:hypothetical protein